MHIEVCKTDGRSGKRLSNSYQAITIIYYLPAMYNANGSFWVLPTKLSGLADIT